MVVDVKSMAELEMAAYDALPRPVQKVFDGCPRKTSVLKIMSMPGVKGNLKVMGADVFARKLRDILHAQAEEEAVFAT